MAGTMVGSVVVQSFMQPLRLFPTIPSPRSSLRLQHLPSVSIPLLSKNDCGNNLSGHDSLLYLRYNGRITSPSSRHLHQRFKPVAALDSDVPQPIQPGEETVTLNTNGDTFKQWDSWTSKFAAGANLPFLLLQLPQILLNARNLMAGNKSALFAVSWLGILTGLLGNLSLLSYFAKKKETEAMIVQCLGVVSSYIVITQLAMAEAMPFLYFISTSVVVGTGIVSNFLNYFGMLHPAVWRLWEDFITIGGLSVLPQVMWSTFVPYIPGSLLPGAVAFVAAIIAVVMARTGKLSEEGVRFVGAISGWTATLLFMWMPIAQMWTNFLNPENIKGLSAISMLLAMIGNGLMIPRALFIRDLMWFIGSCWATFLYGWGNLICLYLFKSISLEFFVASTAGLCIWIGLSFWKDSRAHGHTSPLRSLKELVFGS